MSSLRLPRFAVTGFALTLLSAPLTLQGQATQDSTWASVARVLQGTPVDAGGYTRFNFPRKDLSVRIGALVVPAGFALTSWVGFDGPPGSATAMGDLVVTAAELGPVLAELARRSIAVTAIHNHLVGEAPQVTYIHFHASGAAEATAAALDAVLRLTGAPRPATPAAPQPATIDSARVFVALGTRGKVSGPMAQASILLVGSPVTMGGHAVLPALGLASPVNILQVTPNRAVSTGDLAVTADHLQPLLKALAAGGITATALHTHLVGESPAVYYVHFWGDAPLEVLLQGLKAAVSAGKGG